MTLWGDSAEVQGAELEQGEDAIVSVSSCRVGDYNGAPDNCLELFKLDWLPYQDCSAHRIPMSLTQDSDPCQ